MLLSSFRGHEIISFTFSCGETHSGYDQRAYEQMLSYKELRDMTLKGSFRHEALFVGGCYEFGVAFWLLALLMLSIGHRNRDGNRLPCQTVRGYALG